VLAHCRAGLELSEIVRLKVRWRVSVAALAYRLHKLKLISDWKYRDICIELNSRYKRSEPNPIEREFSAIWDKILRLMWSERLTPSKIAADIGIPETELQDLLFSMSTGQPNEPSLRAVRA